MQLSTPRAHPASNRGSSRSSRITPAFAAAESSPNSRPQPLRASPRRSPPLPPPGWDAQVARIDAKPLSRLVLALFRSKMVLSLGGGKENDSAEPAGSYEAIVDLTRRLNALAPSETAARTQNILRSLFPSWLPGAFALLFSKPFPYISARINAEATALACEWLMGPTEVNGGGGRGETRAEEVLGLPSPPSPSSPSPSSTSPSSSSLEGAGRRTGCKVAYCRYLASTNCVSACLNSCKLPTQAFFAGAMGLPLRMSPNLEDFSCQFSFGVSPDAEEDAALVQAASCLEGCSVVPGNSEEVGDEGAKCPGACALRAECGAS